MKFSLLSHTDLQAIDALKQHYGGASAISQTIRDRRGLETRKELLQGTPFAALVEDAEELVTRFPKIEDFEAELGHGYRGDLGLATSQVSGFQGARSPTAPCSGWSRAPATDEPCWVPSEMISVVALTENYVYSGDLMATLAMAENIMEASKFCSTNLIGTPLPTSRFASLEAVTGKTFETADLGDGMAQIILKNMGTAFGNLGGVEVANDNHLIYLDGVTRAAMETGNDFFLNPSWSVSSRPAISAATSRTSSSRSRCCCPRRTSCSSACCSTSWPNTCAKIARRPIYEVNIGNGVSPENFIRCAEELDAAASKDSASPPTCGSTPTSAWPISTGPTMHSRSSKAVPT